MVMTCTGWNGIVGKVNDFEELGLVVNIGM